jgi:hypothetical protein
MNILHNLGELLTLSPAHLVASLAFLAAMCIANDLVRTALMIEFTRSPLVHAIINMLTLFPAFFLGLILLASAYVHHRRGWINLGYAVSLYFVWYLGSALTRLARNDVEGPDIGFMTVGALITFPLGIVAALVF